MARAISGGPRESVSCEEPGGVKGAPNSCLRAESEEEDKLGVGNWNWDLMNKTMTLREFLEKIILPNSKQKEQERLSIHEEEKAPKALSCVCLGFQFILCLDCLCGLEKRS